MMAIVLMEKGISLVNSFEYPIRFIIKSNISNYNIDNIEIKDCIFLYADTMIYLKIKTCRKTKHVG